MSDIVKEWKPSGLGLKDREITLPVSDTPMIQRNRDMRAVKGRRRSSLGLRGKRVTSGSDGLCRMSCISVLF